MTKKRGIWIGVMCAALLIAGGYYYYSTKIVKSVSSNTEEPPVQTAVARRGDIVISASGTGSVVPVSEIGMGFSESGTLIELNVNVGEQVEVGKLLARLQTQNSAESISAEIAEAELAVVTAKNALEDLYANAEISRTNALNDIAVYTQEVRDAEYQMDNYIMPTYLIGLDTVEALDVMRGKLDAALAAFEPYKYSSTNNPTRQKLLEDLNEAQSSYDAAVKRLDYEYVLQVAKANLDKTRQDYEKYKEGPAPDEVAEAEAELANAQAKLNLAQSNKSELTLMSPINGTVLDVAANVGEVVGTDPIITLADMGQTILEVYLDETDLDKVAVGYEAEVVFDAFPDITFSGEVISVSPSLEDVEGVQAVKARVLMDQGILDPNITLPAGLNASVDIIGGKAENAVLIPVEALRELDPGEYAVFIMEGNEPVLRRVQVGLMDITYAEIISGVEDGDIVTTGITKVE